MSNRLDIPPSAFLLWLSGISILCTLCDTRAQY